MSWSWEVAYLVSLCFSKTATAQSAATLPKTSENANFQVADRKSGVASRYFFPEQRCVEG